MTGLASFETTGPIGPRATLGAIVLQMDETVEPDLHRLLGQPDVALYVSRVPSGADVTPETLRRMQTDLPRAAGLLPPAAPFDVIGYACTSGTTMIGAEAVAALVRAGRDTRDVTDPLTAAKAAFRTLGARRIGVVSPYIDSVSGPVCRALTADGLTLAGTASFGVASEARVARIAPASTRAAALSVGAGADAVFLSCTNLRTLEVLGEIEAALGVPTISSNLALAWHMGQLAGGLALTRSDLRLLRASP